MSIKNDYDIPNYGEIKGIVGEIFHGEKHDDYDFTKLVALGGENPEIKNTIDCVTGNSFSTFYTMVSAFEYPIGVIVFDREYMQFANIELLNGTPGSSLRVYYMFKDIPNELYEHKCALTSGQKSCTICSYFGKRVFQI